jgi:TatD DNase family protein
MAEGRDRIPTFPGSGKQVVLPYLGAPTADTHAHLDMIADPAGALARAARAGVTLVCTVVDLSESPEVTFDGLSGWLAEAANQLAGEAAEGPGASAGDTVGAEALGGLAVPEVRLIVGVHPHNASHYGTEMQERLRAVALAPHSAPVVGLGESGLDFHYDHSPRDAQRDAFRRQLALAHELGLPVTVHLREAHEEGLAILAECGVPSAGCVIHCFTEGPEMARRFLALSEAVSISIAGPVTFAKAERVRDALRVIPPDRMLLETDSPFLAPAPYRGEPNEPAFTVLNAAKVAEVLGLDAAEVASRCLENARRVFAVREAAVPGGGIRP